MPPPKQPAPDPFGDLWALDGSLAETVRGNKAVKMTPAVFAAASMDTMLLEDGGHVRVEGAARVYATRKHVDVATMRLSGEVLVVRFVAPRHSDELGQARHFYTPVRGKPGWLEFRRPATRDPRPALDANLGAVLGRAKFERR